MWLREWPFDGAQSGGRIGAQIATNYSVQGNKFPRERGFLSLLAALQRKAREGKARCGKMEVCYSKNR